MIDLTRRQLLSCCAALPGVMGMPAFANASEPKPTEPVVLSITGNIGVRNTPEGFDFDMPMLAALPQLTLHTRTPWHNGLQTFTGPLLRDVLGMVKPKGQQLMARALNDYHAALPLSDAQAWSVILARLHNGEPMSVRRHGPLFIVYPYDTSSTLREQRYINRSVWQLRTLEVS